MSQLIQEIEGKSLTIKLRGQFIGGEETESLEDMLKSDAGKGIDKVIVDMEEVSYMNSMALGVLIGANSNLKRKGMSLVIVNVPNGIMDLFKMTKLDKLLLIA